MGRDAPKDDPRLADALDKCLEQVRQGQTVDQVLVRYPAEAQELRPLLEVASHLGSLPEPNVSIQGLMRTLGRIGGRPAAPGGSDAPQRKARWFSRQVWGRAAAIVLLVLFTGWGTVNASANAVPGDLLYPLKLFTERARFVLSLNAQDRAELRIVFSSRRLREAVAQQQRTGEVDPGLLKKMLEEARLAVLTAPQLSEPGRQLLISRTAHMTDYQLETLDRFAPDSQAQQQLIDQYREMCQQRGQWMRQMLDPADNRAHGSADNPAQTQPQPRPTWGRWRENCPMW
jgi:hypothetical protein